MTTVHAYTADQICWMGRTRICVARVPRRSTFIPTSTGAAKALGS